MQLIKAEELSLAQDSALNRDQLQHLLKHTPAKYVKTRPAKGGGQWKYVTGGYVKKCLNLMFGFDWSFEITEQQIMHGEAIVKGRLTINSNGRKIVKEQFGNKDIICKKNTDIPLSIGNDLKAAATDCLKKCAAEIGIAADIYNAEEFREVTLAPDVTLDMVRELYELKKDALGEDAKHIERIIANKEADKYESIYELLQSL